MLRTAVFSPCRTYRYQLRRQWAEGSTLVVVGLNPSTADDKVDDPTIRRCIGFATTWGYSGLIMLNLYAYRATDPKELVGRAHAERVGPNNLTTLRDRALARNVLVAWGVHGALDPAWTETVLVHLRSQARSVACLGLTREGHPRHPLYVKANTLPIPFS